MHMFKKAFYIKNESSEELCPEGEINSAFFFKLLCENSFEQLKLKHQESQVLIISQFFLDNSEEPLN